MSKTNPADALAALADEIETAALAAPLVLGRAAIAISPALADDWISRLRALASLKGEAEPVAWQARSLPDGDWMEISKANFHWLRNDWRYEVRVLYTTPPAPQAVVEVAEARVEAALAVLGLRADRKDDVRAALRVALSTPSPAPQGGGNRRQAVIDAIRRDLDATGSATIRYAELEMLLATPPAQQPGEVGEEIVGHKTFSDGAGGFRHEPLTRAEADVLIAHCKSEDERRKALMPDERSAIRMMMDAHTRLTDMGWKDAIYCPKDGTAFEVIEPGSTGIHKCVYWGDWPNGGWWVMADSDMCPSRPVLFRALAPKEKGNG